jgi:hypothetical protein
MNSFIPTTIFKCIAFQFTIRQLWILYEINMKYNTNKCIYITKHSLLSLGMSNLVCITPNSSYMITMQMLKAQQGAPWFGKVKTCSQNKTNAYFIIHRMCYAQGNCLSPYHIVWKPTFLMFLIEAIIFGRLNINPFEEVIYKC